MNWQDIKTKIIEQTPFKKKIKAVSEDGQKRAIKHVFEKKVIGQIDVEQLKQLIYLSPWIAIGQKHTCKTLVKENGEQLLQVQFKALSKEKIQAVEAMLNTFLDEHHKAVAKADE
mgnify:CR=1 FL=1